MEHLAKLKVPNMSQAVGQLFPLLGLITVVKQTMPPEGHEFLHYCKEVMKNLLNPYCFFTINEFEGNSLNDLYKDIHLHLEACKAYNKAKRVTLFRQLNTSSVTVRLANSSDVIVDTYKGMTVWWTHYEDVKDKFLYRGPFSSSGRSSSREFRLKIRKRDKAKLLPEYLDFITQNARTHSAKTRRIKIYTNSLDSHGYHQYTTNGARRMWEEIAYRHPSSFDTLAMEPCLKAKIIADLTSFTRDKSFYERAGRAWKRGYLLYGPPGTGKSSTIAAMANFLKYDIYDLELSQVRTNGDLRQLLVQTTNRSLILLEDIDCSVKFTTSRAESSGSRSSRSMMQMSGDVLNPEDDPSRVTLSGLLNFVDGLWSCCGDERIFVFTTNHIQKLDKALLRPGRMDMQIELSYCTFPSFRVLAQNYLSIQDHPLFDKLESAFLGKTLTPAHIAELLIKDKDNVDIALESVISALESNVPEVPEADSGGSDATTICKDSVVTSKNDPSVDSSSISNVSREDLIEVLQGVIEVLETNSSLTSSQHPEAAISNVKELINSMKATFLKNAGEGKLDSAIEGVIQALAAKLPMCEVQRIFNVKPTADDATGNAASSLPPKLKSGSSSKATSNGVHVEIESVEIK